MKWKEVKKTNEYKTLTKTNRIVFKKFVKSANEGQQEKMIDILDKQVNNLLLLRDMIKMHKKTGDCKVLTYKVDNFM